MSPPFYPQFRSVDDGLPPGGSWCWVSRGDENVFPAMRDPSAAGGWTNEDTWEDFHSEIKLWAPIEKPALQSSEGSTMNVDKLRELFDLLQQLYAEKQEESGMRSPIPFAWARNDETGEMVIYSAFGAQSRSMAEALKIPWTREVIHLREVQDLAPPDAPPKL